MKIGIKKILTLTIFLILSLSSLAYAFEYVTHKNLVSYTSPTQPAKGGSITDSDFNTTFYRVSNASADGVGDTMASVVYSRWTPLNSGQTYLYLQRTVGNPDALIYSATDYSLIKILPSRITIDGVSNQSFNSMEGSDIRWDYSGSYANRFYYVNGAKFYQYDVSIDTANLLHDFTNEYPTATKVHNDVEGDSSADSRYWAFMVKSGSSLLAIITYDKQTDTILGTMDLAEYQALGGTKGYLPIPNMVDMAPDGSKVVLLYGRNATEGQYFNGPHAFNLDFSGTPIKVSIDQTHSGWAYDLSGNLVFVSQNNVNDWIEARNIQTGEITQILYHGDLGWGNGMHFARMPSSIRGWVLMSTYKSTNVYWGDNQLMILEIKDQSESPRVWRLGHTHNNYNEYYAEAFAAMSQFGDKIWWGAKWPGQNNIETYEMTLPSNWWVDLAGGEDTTAPAAVSNLLASTGSTRGKVNLTWTAPGDDNSTGTAATYVIKYSTADITNDTLFDAATDVTGEPTPSAAGTSESMTVSGLTAGTTYYFAMKTQDEVPNTSELSNSTSATAKTNSAPVLASIGNKSVDENSALTFTISATDADSDTLSYSATGLPSGASLNSSSGAFSWTPSYSQEGSYSVTFSVGDGNGGTDSEAITITVSNVNQAPVLASIGNKSVNENSALSFSISATDNDGDTVGYSVSGLPSGASFNTSSGAFSWTPTYTQAGSYNVTFGANDGNGGTDSEIITITVSNVNRAPVLASVGNKTGNTGESLSFTISATDADSDTLTYSATGLPSGATISSSTGAFSWTPGYSQSGSHSVTFSVSDGNGGTDSEAITISITQTDSTAPYVSGLNPEADEVQVPTDSNIVFHIKDAGIGVDSSTIQMTVQRKGDSAATSIIVAGASVLSGYANAVAIGGSSSDYAIVYDPPNAKQYRFAHNEIITLNINASDLSGNAMSAYSYSFTTAMVVRGPNLKVNNSSRTTVNKDNSAMVMDSSGANIYAAWQEDADGGIWYAQSSNKGESFGTDTNVNAGISGTNINPAIAADNHDNIYIVWQNEATDGNVDLYFARKLAGESAFATEVIPIDTYLGISDQAQPAIDAYNTGDVFITWINQSSGTNKVYYAKSADNGASFWIVASSDIKQVDDGSASAAQYPSISTDVDGANTYIAWAATESGKSHIFLNKFNSSNTKVFSSDVQVDDGSRDSVNKPNLNTRPSAEAGEEAVNICVVWESELSGDNDIFFDKSTDGSSWGTDIQVNDDAVVPQAQEEAKVAVDSNGDVYVVWSDLRNGDRDIYLASSIDKGASFETNILVNDDSGTAVQDNPSLFVNTSGTHLCIAWTDYRNEYSDIYFNRNSYYDTDNSASSLVSNTSGGTVTANGDTDISGAAVVIPDSVLDVATTIIITKVTSTPSLGNGSTKVGKVIDFGPGGMQFSSASTIKIPYTQADLTTAGVSNPQNLKLYYYNLKTLLWQQVSGVTVDTINQVVTANVTHFSMYGLAYNPSEIVVELGGGGGGGGGCFIATAAYGSYMADDVMILRIFRDEHLLTNKWGKEFVKFYYRHSPPLADYIAKRPLAKKIVRAALKPLIYIVKLLEVKDCCLTICSKPTDKGKPIVR